MKRNRLILALLWIASLIAISFFGGPVSYGMFVFFTLVPAVSLLYIFLVICFFRIYQEIDVAQLKAGNPSRLYFTLQNESPIAFCGVRVLFYSSFSSIIGLSDKTEYELLPGDGIKKNTGIVCRYRGEYEVGIKSIVITDFLRLFSITYNNREPVTVMVKPDIIHLEKLRGVDDPSSLAESAAAKRTVPGAASRQYVSGDDVRMINWKQSAAKGELFVRDMTGNGKQGIGIIMDPKRYGSTKEEYLPVENRMLEILIALTLFYCKKNIPVKLFHTPDRLEKNAVEMRSFEAFYQEISEYSFKAENDTALFYDRLIGSGEIFEQRCVFIISGRRDESVKKLEDGLSDHGIPAKTYVVTNEKDDRGTVPLSGFLSEVL